LARPGGALDRKRAVLERRDEPARRAHTGLVPAAQGSSRVAGDARRPAQEQIARRPMGARGVDAVLDDEASEAEEGSGHLARGHVLMREDAGRVDVLAGAALLDVERMRPEVDRDDLPEVLIKRKRELQPVAAADAGLLGREAVSVHRLALGDSGRRGAWPARARRFLVEQ